MKKDSKREILINWTKIPHPEEIYHQVYDWKAHKFRAPKFASVKVFALYDYFRISRYYRYKFPWSWIPITVIDFAHTPDRYNLKWREGKQSLNRFSFYYRQQPKKDFSDAILSISVEDFYTRDLDVLIKFCEGFVLDYKLNTNLHPQGFNNALLTRSLEYINQNYRKELATYEFKKRVEVEKEAKI